MCHHGVVLPSSKGAAALGDQEMTGRASMKATSWCAAEAPHATAAAAAATRGKLEFVVQTGTA
jgi:hypothetical protein